MNDPSPPSIDVLDAVFLTAIAAASWFIVIRAAAGAALSGIGAAIAADVTMRVRR